MQGVAILRDFPKIVYGNSGENATHTSFNSVTLKTYIEDMPSLSLVPFCSLCLLRRIEQVLHGAVVRQIFDVYLNVVFVPLF